MFDEYFLHKRVLLSLLLCFIFKLIFSPGKIHCAMYSVVL